MVRGVWVVRVGSFGNPALLTPKIGVGKGAPFKMDLLSRSLVAPYRAILRYYRCDTPYRAILFKEGEHFPNRVRYPPLALSFTQAQQCDTPFCNISRDNCAMPHKNKHERVLRYYRYKCRAI